MRHKSSCSQMSAISFELLVRVITISSVSSRLTSFCKLHRLYFKELAYPAKTTPSLILNPNPNRICLTSFRPSLVPS